MTDNCADPAVVDCRIGVGIEVWCLQDGGGEDDARSVGPFQASSV